MGSCLDRSSFQMDANRWSYRIEDNLGSVSMQDALASLKHAFSESDMPLQTPQQMADGMRVPLGFPNHPNAQGEIRLQQTNAGIQARFDIQMRPTPDTPKPDRERIASFCKTMGAVAKYAQELNYASRSAPPGRDDLNKLRPKSTFDAAAARRALEEGSGTIEGVACTVHAGVRTRAFGMPIALFPVTPYLHEFLELSRSAKEGRDQLDIDPAFFQHVLVGETNDNGAFRFSRLKPGRYYLTMTAGASIQRERDVVVGTYTNAYGSRTNITRKQPYVTHFGGVIYEFVEITQPGQTVRTTLANRGSLTGWKAGC